MEWNIFLKQFELEYSLSTSQVSTYLLLTAYYLRSSDCITLQTQRQKESQSQANIEYSMWLSRLCRVSEAGCA